MDEIHWTNYVAMGTGIAGLVLGYLGYRRSNAIKSLDLRVELRKSIQNLNSIKITLKRKLDSALSARYNAESLNTGLQRSEITKWHINYESDLRAYEELENQIPPDSEFFNSFGPEKLESELLRVNQLIERMTLLIRNYEELTEQENERVRQYHDDVRAGKAVTLTPNY